MQSPISRTPAASAIHGGSERASRGFWAGSSTVLVEDDPYGELRFMGENLPPIRASMSADTAILLGTFSKIVAPGLRIGWVCAGKEIMERLIVAKQAADLHCDGLSQRIVYRFMLDSDFDAHVTRIREGYKAQRDLMVELATRLFPAEVTCTHPEGGMFLWMTLPPEVSALALFEKALEQKVAFVPGEAFFANGGGKNTLRLNFSNSDTARIEEGMKRLARVFAGMRTR
jgi:2-aminoadipate transaminase